MYPEVVKWIRFYALVGIVPLLLSFFVDGSPQVWIPLVVTSAVIEALGLWVLRKVPQAL